MCEVPPPPKYQFGAENSSYRACLVGRIRPGGRGADTAVWVLLIPYASSERKGAAPLCVPLGRVLPPSAELDTIREEALYGDRALFSVHNVCVSAGHHREGYWKQMVHVYSSAARKWVEVLRGAPAAASGGVGSRAMLARLQHYSERLQQPEGLSARALATAERQRRCAARQQGTGPPAAALEAAAGSTGGGPALSAQLQPDPELSEQTAGLSPRPLQMALAAAGLQRRSVPRQQGTGPPAAPVEAAAGSTGGGPALSAQLQPDPELSEQTAGLSPRPLQMALAAAGLQRRSVPRQQGTGPPAAALEAAAGSTGGGPALSAQLQPDPELSEQTAGLSPRPLQMALAAAGLQRRSVPRQQGTGPPAAALEAAAGSTGGGPLQPAPEPLQPAAAGLPPPLLAVFEAVDKHCQKAEAGVGGSGGLEGLGGTIRKKGLYDIITAMKVLLFATAGSVIADVGGAAGR